MILIENTLNAISENSEAIIALCALFLTVWQGLLQRRHNILSSAPHLTFDGTTQNVSPQIKLTLTNHGLGPAFIESFRVTFDGVDRPMSDEGIWIKIAADLDLNIKWGGGKSFNCGDALAAGQSCTVFMFKTANESESEFKTALAANQLSRIGIVIKYKSSYNKTYVLKLNRWQV